MFCQLVTSKRELWVVETAGGLFHSLTFAVSVETLLGKKGPAVTLLGKKGPAVTLLGKKGPAVASSIELSHLELV